MEKKKSNQEFLPAKMVLEKEPIEILRHLKDNRAILTEVYTSEEINALYCRALDNLYTDEEEASYDRRHSWLCNHTAIIQCLQQQLNESARMPTVIEISRKTGLSRVTVTKHLKYFEKDEYLDFHRQKWKLVTERILTKLAQYVLSPNTSEKDSTKAATVYLKYADRFLTPIKEAGATQNFIQINNIYISQETIKALPEEKREVIEAIILNSNALPYQKEDHPE